MDKGDEALLFATIRALVFMAVASDDDGITYRCAVCRSTWPAGQYAVHREECELNPLLQEMFEPTLLSEQTPKESANA